MIPGPNHDGGTMVFGPDGKLYVVIGELNRDGQLQNVSGGAAPDNTGVIFRINDDGSAPSDNPFFALGGNLAKYFAYGIRNSFGLAFDPLTRALWDTENGPTNYDEINLVQPGFNSGWNRIMGPVSRDAEGTTDLVQFPGSQYADPKFSWFNTVGPTAIAFLNSNGLGPRYENDVFVGDINNGRLYHFKPNAARNGFIFANAGLADLVADNGAELQEVIVGTGFGGITDLKVGPDGLLYVLSFSLGKIFVLSGKPAAEFTALSVSPGQFSVLASGAEIGGLARGPAFQLFNASGALQTTQFALNPDFGGLSFVPGNFDADAADEVLVGGRETTGLARGPAYQVFDNNGSLLLTRFVLNPDFTDISFAPFSINASNGVLVCGRESSGLMRGPAYQAFDSAESLVRTQFALNT
ncbi:MAG: PQQ-dependent sugar dehydrogenase, partial [Armatimonadota bacterium]|nr:PQQ-dependent sugar dehydrogenase [Armatimonadota bacterium]